MRCRCQSAVASGSGSVLISTVGRTLPFRFDPSSEEPLHLRPHVRVAPAGFHRVPCGDKHARTNGRRVGSKINGRFRLGPVYQLVGEEGELNQSYGSGSGADQLQSLAEREFTANLKGLASIVSELRIERTNLVNQLKRVDAALSVLGKLNGGSSYTNRGALVSLGSQADEPRAERGMGKESHK